jgi:excinuclease ABC subunit B
LEQAYQQSEDLPLENIPELITQLEAQMKEAAKNLEFEDAAMYRDRIKHLRERLVGNRTQADAS